MLLFGVCFLLYFIKLSAGKDFYLSHVTCLTTPRSAPAGGTILLIIIIIINMRIYDQMRATMYS